MRNKANSIQHKHINKKYFSYYNSEIVKITGQKKAKRDIEIERKRKR